MDLKKLNKREYYGAYILVFIVIAVLIGIMMNPGKKDTKASEFAKPLFEHAAPKDTTVLAKSEDGGKEGGKSYYFACLVLQSKLSKEELEAFYGDDSYAPAAQGQEVTLQVLPVEGDSIDVVKSSEAYQDGAGDLWYIYLYSTEP